METKIQLSADEWNLVQDAALLLTKNRVMEKMMQQFGQLATLSEQIFNPGLMFLPPGVRWMPPKISRGEQYEGLPYLILDHPRIFSKEDVLAVRTMFWWGHYFSVTLHLKGIYREAYEPALTARGEALGTMGYWWNTGVDEWKHQVAQPYYAPMSSMSKNDIIKNGNIGGFIKIAVRIPLDQFDSLPLEAGNHYRLLADILGVNYRGGGTGLSPDSPKAGSGL